MEFNQVCLLAACVGGVLGLIYGKRQRNKPEKTSTTTRWCISSVLGLLMFKALGWNLGICIALGLLCSEAVGMTIPRGTKDE